MDSYTYNDLLHYLNAARRFHVVELEYDDPIYYTIRKRSLNDAGWNSKFIPMFKNDPIYI